MRRTRDYTVSNSSPCNGLEPIQLTRHLAIATGQIVAALAVLSALGANVKCVKSHGAEQEIVAQFPNLGTINTFQRKFC